MSDRVVHGTARLRTSLFILRPQLKAQVATLIKHQDGIAICDVCVEHAHQIVAMSRAGRKSMQSRGISDAAWR
jgi:hypothetical protein